jgi:hypothetical protein
MYDGMDELAGSEEFATLLARIEKMAAHHEQHVLNAATDKPIETIRYEAGRANGVRLVYDMLLTARKEAKRGQT